jgi:hypothetical protein
MEHMEQGGHITGDSQARTNYEMIAGWGTKYQGLPRLTEDYPAHLKDKVSGMEPEAWV